MPDGATPDGLCRLGCVGSVERWPFVTQAFEEPLANDRRPLRLAPAPAASAPRFAEVLHIGTDTELTHSELET